MDVAICILIKSNTVDRAIFIDTPGDENSTLHAMALVRYMKPGCPYGLPDPRGLLLASVPSRAIAETNKRGPGGSHATSEARTYVKLSSSQRCEIAKYADQHGAAETAR